MSVQSVIKALQDLGRHFSDPKNHLDSDRQHMSQEELSSVANGDKFSPEVKVVANQVLFRNNYQAFTQLSKGPAERADQISLQDITAIISPRSPHANFRRWFAYSVRWPNGGVNGLKIPPRKTNTNPQKLLDRLTAKLVGEKLIDTHLLLGGRVLMFSEFKKDKYPYNQKEKEVPQRAQDITPTTIKFYKPGPNGKDAVKPPIYIIFPDSFAFFLEDPACDNSMRDTLYHEFMHVRDDDDIVIFRQFIEIFQTLRPDVPMQQVSQIAGVFSSYLMELRTVLLERNFIIKEGRNTEACGFDRNSGNAAVIVSKMMEINDYLSKVNVNFPDVVPHLVEALKEFINRTFNETSPQTKSYVNGLMAEFDLPPIG